MTTKQFFIRGLHCSACELLIEKKLVKQDPIEEANVSLSKNTLTVKFHSDAKITAEYLNNLFSADSYRFSTKPFRKSSLTPEFCPVESKPNWPKSIFMALVFLAAFFLLNKTGFASLVSVNSTSGLPLFLVFGLLAGFSSCAALVGGIILSLSKQWNSMYSTSDSTTKKLEPHLLFNGGRLISYTVLGAVLGGIGNFFRFSPTFTAGLVVLVSVAMIFLGLQMLGVKYFQKFQIRLPKSFTRHAANESNFTGRFAPMLMGALTFFLPCGFTITAQALALSSGSPLQGALIMGLFALGTLPGLLLIGLSSVKLFSNPKISGQFSTIAGFLVLFFALFNINAQLAVLGAPNLNTVLTSSVTTTNTNSTSVPVVNGQQVITMLATSGGYQPNQFTVKVGVPVSWQITNDGSAGCGGSIVAQGLFPDRIDTISGQIVTKEFTPTKTGVYRFSCTMGMYTGTITVVDASGSTGTTSNTQPIGSGSKGCGCGGGGSAGAGTTCH